MGEGEEEVKWSTYTQWKAGKREGGRKQSIRTGTARGKRMVGNDQGRENGEKAERKKEIRAWGRI